MRSKPHYRLHYVARTFIGWPAWWVEGPGCTSHGSRLYGSARKAWKYKCAVPF